MSKVKPIELEKNLNDFLVEKKLKLVKKISKGFSSEVFLVKNMQGKKFALKIEREKSPREKMAVKEVENLKLANSVGVGPKLIDFDFEKKIILLEFVEGRTFSKWLFEAKPSKAKLQKFLNTLFEQARRLDEIGLDHGQLAGKGKNILVKNGKPVIIDFEKASQNRKVHNVSQLEAFFFRNPHSIITKKVKEILS